VLTEDDSVVEEAVAGENGDWTISAPTPWDTSSFAGLREILREDRASANSALHVPGIQAIVVHRFGEWINGYGPPRLLRRPAAILHRLALGYVRNFLGYEIAKSARLGRRVRFYHQHGIVIDKRCVIGDDCVFLHGVALVVSPNSHAKAPQIGARVLFGTGCVVLGGVRIGDGATIGPNAVVTRDVPPGASAVAPPARVLRLRRDRAVEGNASS
jgi:serine O-acetyltransferase